MSLLVTLLLVAPLVADTEQTKLNPAYAALLNEGVVVTAEQRVKLPPPIMPDGLEREAQQEAIRKASDKYEYDRFVRNSVVAPYVYDYRTIDEKKGEYLVYGVDVSFVAYGTLESLAELDPKQFFNLTESAGEAEVTVLDEAALERHSISPTDREGLRERYEHVAYPLFDKVHIRITNQANLSETDESVVRATRLDERFAESDEFPNQWRSMNITGTGEVEYGPTHVFRGTGMYLKITELIEPEGALFVEYHTVSVEPHGWFNGAPLIRSKLRLLLQREVRKFRHTLGQ